MQHLVVNSCIKLNYFSLSIVSLEAVTAGINSARTPLEVGRIASERVIVRASNPGQFEADNEPPWTRDPCSDAVYHMGKLNRNHFTSC